MVLRMIHNHRLQEEQRCLLPHSINCLLLNKLKEDPSTQASLPPVSKAQAWKRKETKIVHFHQPLLLYYSRPEVSKSTSFLTLEKFGPKLIVITYQNS